MSFLFHVVTSPFVSASIGAHGLFLVAQLGTGEEFPMVSTYQPHNKGSLWVAAGVGGPGLVCSRGLCLSNIQAGLVNSSLNFPPPSSEMETETIAVVPATDMRGAHILKKKKKKAIFDKDLSAMFFQCAASGHTWIRCLRPPLPVFLCYVPFHFLSLTNLQRDFLHS